MIRVLVWMGRILPVVLLVSGAAAWAWFGGRSSLAVKREAAALAREDARRPKAVIDLRASEEARLHSGPVPIEEAMHRLAMKGRVGYDARLTPQPSVDTAPLMGWVYQPHDVPEWMMAAPADAGPPLATKLDASARPRRE